MILSLYFCGYTSLFLLSHQDLFFPSPSPSLPQKDLRGSQDHNDSENLLLHFQNLIIRILEWFQKYSKSSFFPILKLFFQSLVYKSCVVFQQKDLLLKWIDPSSPSPSDDFDHLENLLKQVPHLIQSSGGSHESHGEGKTEMSSNGFLLGYLFYFIERVRYDTHFVQHHHRPSQAPGTREEKRNQHQSLKEKLAPQIYSILNCFVNSNNNSNNTATLPTDTTATPAMRGVDLNQSQPQRQQEQEQEWHILFDLKFLR
jgi:hypothetical protein